MSEYFILKNKEAVPVDLETWARWLENARDRIVAQTGVRDKLSIKPFVSTVFLGLDHSYGQGPPEIFETMIFGGEHDQWQERCSTWEEAEEMHAKACKLAGLS